METPCVYEMEVELELLPMDIDYAAWEGVPFPEAMDLENAESDASGPEVNRTGRKRKREDEERPRRRRRLDPFTPMVDDESPWPFPFIADLSLNFAPTVESITRGIAQLAISSPLEAAEAEQLPRL
ncbi:hypothetical protein FGB62_7g641 [Gracilaria domingensis]|nr:hypothetical protein FGB62_7g641 [Gracilaria domingensis]